jgi:hypothetical protein
VPTLFANSKIPKYFDKKINKRKLPTQRIDHRLKRRRSANVQTSAQNYSFEALIQDRNNIILPNQDWITRFCEESQVLKIIELTPSSHSEADTVHVQASVTVSIGVKLLEFIYITQIN